MFIPEFTPDIDVYVKYHIYTKDPNYSITTGYVDVVQISKAELEMSKLQSGKAYTLRLHLGLESVKVDTTVDDWDETTNDVDLPKNK